MPVSQYINICLSNFIEAGWTKKPNEGPYYSKSNYACHLTAFTKEGKGNKP
jgi:hypothetical protein